MSQPVVEPLEAGLRDLFDAERRRAGAPEATRERVRLRVDETLGIHGGGKGNPEGGESNSGTSGHGSATSAAGSVLGGALGGALLVALVSLGVGGDIGMEARAPVTANSAARVMIAPPAAPIPSPAGVVRRGAPSDDAPLQPSGRPYALPSPASAPSPGRSTRIRISTMGASQRRTESVLARESLIDGPMLRTSGIKAHRPRTGEGNRGPRPVSSAIYGSRGAPPSKGGAGAGQTVSTAPPDDWPLSLSLPAAPPERSSASLEAGQMDLGGGVLLNQPGSIQVDPGSLGNPSEAGSVLWGQRFWGNDVSGGENAGGLSIAVDYQGNTAVTGWFSGTVVFDDDLTNSARSLTSEGRTDIFLVEFGPDGSYRWSKRFGGSGADAGLGVAFDCDQNLLVTGRFTDDLDLGVALDDSHQPLLSTGTSGFLAKLDHEGNHIWSRHFGGGILGGGRAAGLGVVGDSDCNAMVTGWFRGSADFGGGRLVSAGGFDGFLVKIDTDGNHIWSERFGGVAQDIGLSVAIDPSSRQPVVAGLFGDTIDLGGGLLTGGPGLFLAGLDVHGKHRFSERFCGSGLSLHTRVAVDSGDNVLMAGSFQGQIDLGGGPLVCLGQEDVFVARFDSQGKHLWSERLRGSGEQSARGVAVDFAGNVVVTGSFQGWIDLGGGKLVGAGAEDAFVVKLDSAGNYLWGERFGDVASECGYGVAVDRDGDVLMSSGIYRTLDIGVGPPSDARDATVFVAKLLR